MVDLDALTALDALQWLRTSEEVSKRFGLSQTTVSRQSRKCLDLFGLDLQRIEGEWNTVGDATILALERCVHQVARWQGRRPLRLEATYWSGPLLCTPVPDNWILGLANIENASGFVEPTINARLRWDLRSLWSEAQLVRHRLARQRLFQELARETFG